MRSPQRRATVGILIQLLVGVTASPGYGQGDSGSRVRVTTNVRSQLPLVGTLISVDTESLRLRASTTRKLVALPTASIVRLERSRNRRTNAGGGAVLGAAIGGGTGLLLGLIASTEEDSFRRRPRCADWCGIPPRGVGRGPAACGFASVARVTR